MKPQLAVNNEDIAPDPLYELFQELIASDTEFGDGDEPVPAPTKHRHQLLHMDFWFITGALACQLAIMTSFIPMNAFEPLVVASITLLFCAVVSNLTREKQGIIVHEIVHRWAVNIRLPRWAGFGYVPAEKPLFERVQF